MHLRCSIPDCGTTLDLHDRSLACPDCGELLEVVVDPGSRDPADLKLLWLNRRTSYDPRDASGVWRFREFLPDVYSAGRCRDAERRKHALVTRAKDGRVGWFERTPLQASRLQSDGQLQRPGNDGRDDGGEICRAKAVACASTGNTAASLAAYAARAGMVGRVYLPAGQASANKLAQALDYGAETSRSTEASMMR